MATRRTLRELAALVACSQTRGDGPAAATRAGGWRALFAAAFEEGVAGLLLQRLERAGAEVPAAVREEAARRLALDRLAARRLAAACREVLGRLGEAGLRAVVLKGPPLEERLYGGPGLRPMLDVDLLVRPDDLTRAGEVLTALGCRALQPIADGAPADGHDLAFGHPNGALLEIHYRASSGPGTEIPAGDLVGRAVRQRLAGGGTAWVPVPEDELIYLAVHAARHRFRRLGWLCDLDRLLGAGIGLDWPVVGARARGWGVDRALAATFELLRRRLGREVPQARGIGLPRDLRLRAAVALTAPARDDRRYRSAQTLLAAKTWGVLVEQTYLALLPGRPVEGLRYWRWALRRSARSLPGVLRRRRGR